MPTRVEGAPLPRGPHLGPLHLFLHPHTSSSSRKNPPPAQTQVLAHLAAIFDLLARSSIHKTALVCDSSIGPISFCASALFIANFCCIGDPVLELACQIYEVPSNSNAWIASRHLWEWLLSILFSLVHFYFEWLKISEIFRKRWVSLGSLLPERTPRGLLGIHLTMISITGGGGVTAMRVAA